MVINMNQLIDLLTQFNVILISSMLSGSMVKMGKGWGKILGGGEFVSFYKLFFVFIIENMLITVGAQFIIFPVFSQFLYQNAIKAVLISIEMVLIFNIWFSRTFGYKYRKEILASLAIVIMILLVA